MIFYWSEESHTMGYWLGFWTPLIDGFAVGLLAIYLRGKYEKELNDKNNELQKTQDEIKAINKNLEKIVDQKIKEIREKDKILIEQSKLTTMGEMIGNIAHQWRQPLNSLAIMKEVLVDKYYFKELDDDSIEKYSDDVTNTLEYLSQTIDDFRNFFEPSKERVEFELLGLIESIMSIVSPQLHAHHISIDVDKEHQSSIYINSYPNEFKQVLINIINNAKDAIMVKQSENTKYKGTIKISKRAK
jgi:signal transduction histidine kinase